MFWGGNYAYNLQGKLRQQKLYTIKKLQIL
jgi:hypothetical protein